MKSSVLLGESLVVFATFGLLACSSGKTERVDSGGVDLPLSQDNGASDAQAEASPDAHRSDSGGDLALDTIAPRDGTVDGPASDTQVDGPGIDLPPPRDARLNDAAIEASFVTITAGGFQMGSPGGESCRMSTRENAHPVTLTRDYEIMTTEVTQAMFSALMSYNPSYYQGCDDCPVENINWHEAAAFCNALSSQAGLAQCYDCPLVPTTPAKDVRCTLDGAYASPYECAGYRLPTEAEWEFAYRAGTTTGYYSGDPDAARCSDCLNTDAKLAPIAHYCANSGRPQIVGGKQPNTWGLYDMAGNVWEWCHDAFVESIDQLDGTDPVAPEGSSSRVVRGGGANTYASTHRAAARNFEVPTARSLYQGFRCVRTR